MDWPSLNHPAFLTNYSWPAVMVDVTLAFFFGGFQLPANPNGIASPAMDHLIVQDGYNAGLRQIQEPPGDHFVAGSRVFLLEVQNVVTGCPGVTNKPASGNQ